MVRPFFIPLPIYFNLHQHFKSSKPLAGASAASGVPSWWCWRLLPMFLFTSRPAQMGSIHKKFENLSTSAYYFRPGQDKRSNHRQVLIPRLQNGQTFFYSTSNFFQPSSNSSKNIETIWPKRAQRAECLDMVIVIDYCPCPVPGRL